MLTAQFENFKGGLPPVRPEEVALYEKHFALLKHWNEQFNLVSRNAFEKAFGNHYVDGIYTADLAVALAEGRPLFDVGSGAGFPGLILAIRYPALPIRLYEKSLKKQTFLTTAIVQLGLKNVEVHGLFGETKVKGLVLARAVFPPDRFFKFMGQALLPGSRVIFQRGGQAPVPKPTKGFQLLKSVEYALPQDCGRRQADLFELVPRGTKSG